MQRDVYYEMYTEDVKRRVEKFNTKRLLARIIGSVMYAMSVMVLAWFMASYFNIIGYNLFPGEGGSRLAKWNVFHVMEDYKYGLELQ